MSYELWLEDATSMAEGLPQNSAIKATVSKLVVELAPFGIETDPKQVSYADLDYPGNDKSFPVVLKDSILLDKPYMLSQIAGEAKSEYYAFVLHGLSRSALILPQHVSSTPLSNGSVILHELLHLTQYEKNNLAEYRPLPGQSQTFVNAEDMRRIQQTTGMAEREAYGLNLDIMRAMDGKGFDDYLERWSAASKVIGRQGSQYASIQFNEARYPWMPTVRQPWSPFESLSLRQQAQNRLAKLPFFAKSMPKPDKGTYAHELWSEGPASRHILRNIGRMGVMERELGGKLPDVRLDEAAGAIFNSSTRA